jgi:hypothetical protein
MGVQLRFTPRGTRMKLASWPLSNVQSPHSLYRRFFGVKLHFSETELSLLLNIDFTDHVALVAVVQEASLAVIVGGGRYVAVEAGRAEIAFAVIDQY